MIPKLVNLKMCKFSTFPQELCTPFTLGEIKKNANTFFRAGDLVLVPFDEKEQTKYEQFYLQYTRAIITESTTVNTSLILMCMHLPVSVLMDELLALKSLVHNGIVFLLYRFVDKEGVDRLTQEKFPGTLTLTLGYNEVTKLLEIQQP